MRNNRGWKVALVAAVSLGGAVAFANELSPGDRQFVDRAATINQFEIKAGSLALDRASSPEVKTFARKMIDDHGAVANQLKQIATREGFQLPTNLTPEQNADYQKLARLSGAAFDRAYLDLMTNGHKQAIELFQTQAQTGDDPTLKAFAQKTLPSLHQHENMAERDLHKM
jgi:putative membrane protein